MLKAAVAASTFTASDNTLPPRLYVTVNLPPVISFSSPEEPQLELHITL